MTHGAAGLLLGLACALAQAQTTVYESRDKAGPVFSDRPSAGAAPVEVAPPNVIAAPPPPKVDAPAAAPAPRYRSLAITSITDGGTIRSNSGAFDFKVRAVPALRPGDSLRVVLDGQRLPASFTTPNLHVTEDDWRRIGDTGAADHGLQVAIVDAQGAVVIESVPLRFYLRRATTAKR